MSVFATLIVDTLASPTAYRAPAAPPIHTKGQIQGAQGSHEDDVKSAHKDRL